MSIAADTLTIPAAPVRGPGFYFNGVTSKRHDVIVQTAANSLRIINDDEQYLVDEWNYADLRSRSAPEGILRLVGAARRRWRASRFAMPRLPPPSESARPRSTAAALPTAGCASAWSF